MKLSLRLLAFGIGAMLLAACGASTDIGVRSPAFDDGKIIPVENTCDGADTAPTLTLDNLPKNTKSLAILVDDIDAPKHRAFVHWMAWNIPTSPLTIVGGDTASGSLQGKNSFNRIGYSGPCPDPGPKHHYVFTVYALNTLLTKAPQSRDAFKSALRFHVIGKGTLTGTYQISSPRPAMRVNQPANGTSVGTVSPQ